MTLPVAQEWHIRWHSLRGLLQQCGNEVLCILRDLLKLGAVEVVPCLSYPLHYRMNVVHEEWRYATQSA